MSDMLRKILLVSLILSLLLWLMNKAAYAYSLFWIWWWYDIPMHFLGGMVIGSFSLWFFGRLQENSPYFSRISLNLLVALSVLVIGSAWEIYEYTYQLTFNGMISYPVDTIKDFILDFAGAAAVLYWYIRQKSPTGKTL